MTVKKTLAKLAMGGAKAFIGGAAGMLGAWAFGKIAGKVLGKEAAETAKDAIDAVCIDPDATEEPVTDAEVETMTEVGDFVEEVTETLMEEGEGA